MATEEGRVHQVWLPARPRHPATTKLSVFGQIARGSALAPKGQLTIDLRSITARCPAGVVLLNLDNPLRDSPAVQASVDTVTDDEGAT